MPITLVKKIKADGAPCRKCAEVEQRLRDSNLWHRIDRIVIADERDPESEGMQLATQYQVDLAPFFIVEEDGHPAQVHTIYTRFVKEVLKAKTSEQEELAEVMENNNLDYL